MKSIQAYISLFTIFILATTAQAESLHNESHTATNAAYKLLFYQGCEFAEQVRKEQFKVIQEPGGVRIIAKEIFIPCVKAQKPDPNPDLITWKYPSTRLNGDTMTKAEIASFEIYECSGAAKLISVTEAPSIDSLPSGVYCLRAVDTNGIKSPLSAGMSL